jgi:hypothetical protein
MHLGIGLAANANANVKFLKSGAALRQCSMQQVARSSITPV